MLKGGCTGKAAISNMLTEKSVRLHTSSTRRDFNRILCPTNLTPESDEALRYAVALSRAFNAKLFACHSVEDKKII